MKIVYISSSIVPSHAANSVHVMKMCQALVRAGHEVTLLCRKSDGSCEDVYGHYGVDAHFRIVRFDWPMRRLGGVAYGHAIRHWLKRREAPDLLYGRCPYGLSAAPSTGCLLGYEAHSPPRTQFHALMERWLLLRKEFAGLVVISQALKREYLRLFPFLKETSVLVAHDGADPLPDGTEDVPFDLWRRQKGRLQVGYVGNLYPGKGVEVVVSLASRLPHADFHVVGGTPDLVSQWERDAFVSNLFFHGAVPHVQVLSCLQQFDVVLAPYQSSVGTAGGRQDIARWMSPLKIFEYMAAGKPIVASELPVLQEVLTHRTNALLCPPDDVDAWESAVTLLEQDASLRAQLGESARKGFQKSYSWEGRARVIERFYTRGGAGSD